MDARERGTARRARQEVGDTGAEGVGDRLQDGGRGVAAPALDLRQVADREPGIGREPLPREPAPRPRAPHQRADPRHEFAGVCSSNVRDRR